MSKQKMDDDTLEAIVSAKITNSLGFFGGLISKERVTAMEYYNGQPFGNEVDGRSQVVSRDVAELVDGMMPSLVRTFASGDEVVKFTPTKADEVESAQQATDYCNWVWTTQNPGFKNTYDWAKDGLLQKLGVIKIWWEEVEDVNTESYQALTDMEMQLLQSDPMVEIVEDNAYPMPMELAAAMGLIAPPQPPAQPGQPGQPPAAPVPQPAPPTLHDVQVKRKKQSGRVRIMPVPPEEFLVDRRSVALDETPFLAHRQRKSASQLIEEGYSRELVESLPADGEGDYNMERLERFLPEDELPYRTDGELDESMRQIWVNECYLRVDFDGDGIAEWRKVTGAGDTGSFKIMDNEPCDDHPFAAWSPTLMPHKLIGLSLADQSMDLQLIKSTLWRQVLDNMYMANNARVTVKGEVNLDDLLTVRPGGIVRLGADGEVTAMEVPDVSAGAMSMMEYVDTVKERRTGQSAYNQGLDADALHDTLGGLQKIQDAGNQRLELICRVMAEVGFTRAFKIILHLLTKYQQEPVMIELRGKWVQMDPREWKNHYDMQVQVGIGTGDRQTMAMQMQQLLSLDEKIIQLQGGTNGPLLTLENIYAKLKVIVESFGRKDIQSFYEDPSANPQPPPPPKPDPAMVKVQGDQQLQAAKQQGDQQLQASKIQSDIQLTQAKAESDERVAMVRAQQDAQLADKQQQAQAQQAAQQAALDRQLDAQKHANEMQMEREKFAMSMQLEREKATLDYNKAIEIARINAQAKIAGAQVTAGASDGAQELAKENAD